MKPGNGIRWRQVVQLAGCVVLPAASLVLPVACSADPPAEFSARAFRSGREQVLPPGREGVGSLVEQCVERLASADDVLRLAVSEATIADLKREETVLEVIFAEPRTVTLQLNGAELEVGRLLVPLTGEFAQGSTVIFYGPGPHYGSGPLRSGQDPADLSKTVLELLGSGE